MPDGLDAAEFLDIDMDQLPRLLGLVAHHWRFGFERRQLAEPEAPQNLAYHRNRHAELRSANAATPPQR